MKLFFHQNALMSYDYTFFMMAQLIPKEMLLYTAQKSNVAIE